MEFEWTDEQLSAISLLDRNDIAILCGAPGTGKTTVLREILKRLDERGLSYHLAAPTGKAAKRMSEATGSQATTIHKMLEPWMAGRDFQFRRNEDNPLQCDVVVLDEASMVTNRLMADILRAIVPGEKIHRYNRMRGQKLLIVGDNYQLPSVGPGAVLRDFIASGAIPVVELTKIQRNSGDIVRACHQIKDGIVYEPSEKLDIDAGANLRHLEVGSQDAILGTIDTVISKFQSEGYDPVWDVQVLSPVNERSPLSCAGLNERLQANLNTEPQVGDCPFKRGDKVLYTKNEDAETTDHKPTFLINGDMGTVIDVPEAGSRMVVRFYSPDRDVSLQKNTRNLILAYACTVHRFQGSEAPVVIIPVHPSISFLMDRPWIYTAISRAAKACVTIGEFSVIRRAIGRTVSYDRKTYLREDLAACRS